MGRFTLSCFQATRPGESSSRRTQLKPKNHLVRPEFVDIRIRESFRSKQPSNCLPNIWGQFYSKRRFFLNNKNGSNLKDCIGLLLHVQFQLHVVSSLPKTVFAHHICFTYKSKKNSEVVCWFRNEHGQWRQCDKLPHIPGKKFVRNHKWSVLFTLPWKPVCPDGVGRLQENKLSRGAVYYFFVYEGRNRR